MTSVHVVGATGYAAAELIRLLDAHPDVRIATLESSSSAGKRMCDLFPSLPSIEIVCAPSGAVREHVRAVRLREPEHGVEIDVEHELPIAGGKDFRG